MDDAESSRRNTPTEEPVGDRSIRPDVDLVERFISEASNRLVPSDLKTPNSQVAPRSSYGQNFANYAMNFANYAMNFANYAMNFANYAMNGDVNTRGASAQRPTKALPNGSPVPASLDEILQRLSSRRKA